MRAEMSEASYWIPGHTVRLVDAAEHRDRTHIRHVETVYAPAKSSKDSRERTLEEAAIRKRRFCDEMRLNGCIDRTVEDSGWRASTRHGLLERSITYEFVLEVRLPEIQADVVNGRVVAVRTEEQLDLVELED